jgi:site-specific DNA-methyltransferase (adenine-specific)
MATLADDSIDMVMTDPPYGTTACKWDSIIPLDEMWAALKRITKPNAAIVLMASQPFTTILIGSNLGMFKYCWVWDKRSATGHLNAKHQPMRRTEDVVVFYRDKCNYLPPGLIYGEVEHIGKPNSDCYGAFNRSWISDCSGWPSNIISITSNECGIHPTQKPVALMEYLIKTYTAKGDTVLDFTMGSGTTGVAAKRLDRAFVGIERDDEYFAIAKNRIETAEVQEELFEAEQPEPETQLELNGPEPERTKDDSH